MSNLKVAARQSIPRGALGVVVLAAVTNPAFSCMCVGDAERVSSKLSTADAAFVGKVESRDPDFDFWDPAVRKLLSSFFETGSPKAFVEFKRRYLAVLPEPAREAIAKATNRDQLNAAFDKLTNGRKRVTIRIQQTFKGIDHDSPLVYVWTRFDDCGTHFVKGETYLVYASKDESGLKTNACLHSRRIGEAKDDLANLRHH